MVKHVIRSKAGAPPLGAYSQGWRAGDFIFVTGTGPIGPDGKVHGTTIEEQTEITINNIEAILRAEGAGLQDVIRTTVHLIDTSLFPRYNAVYARRFAEPYPARTTVGSDLRQVPGMMIEIETVAYVGRQGSRPRQTSKARAPRRSRARTATSTRRAGREARRRR